MSGSAQDRDIFSDNENDIFSDNENDIFSDNENDFALDQATVEALDIYPPLPQGPYEIVYADPPWEYSKSQHRKTADGWTSSGGAASHYGTLSDEALCLLPAATIMDDNCLVFMWTSGPKLRSAITVGEAWGLNFITIGFVWDKLRPIPGSYTLSQHEFVLIFKKGRIPSDRGARNIRQKVQEPRGPHSVKPWEVRQRIVDMFPRQRKIELFARPHMSNIDQGEWDVWGLEASRPA